MAFSLSPFRSLSLLVHCTCTCSDSFSLQLGLEVRTRVNSRSLGSFSSSSLCVTSCVCERERKREKVSRRQVKHSGQFITGRICCYHGITLGTSFVPQDSFGTCVLPAARTEQNEPTHFDCLSSSLALSSSVLCVSFCWYKNDWRSFSDGISLSLLPPLLLPLLLVVFLVPFSLSRAALTCAMAGCVSLCLCSLGHLNEFTEKGQLFVSLH